MITKKDLENFEVDTGIKFPSTFLGFLLKNNSRIYYNNEFSIVHSDGYKTSDAIEEFYSLTEIKEGIEYNQYMVDFQTHFELPVDYVESNKLINIVGTLGGSVAISVDGQHKEKIYYLDNGDFGITFLANDILDFLSMLSEK